MKHPPIATALIGAGVLGLWRTTPMRVEDQDYLGRAVTEVAETVKKYAGETVAAAREKSARMRSLLAKPLNGLLTPQSEDAAESFEHAREFAKPIPDNALDAAQRATSQFSHAINEEGVRDQLLLGVPGLAVAAAVGVAYKRRAGDELRPLD